MVSMYDNKLLLVYSFDKNNNYYNTYSKNGNKIFTIEEIKNIRRYPLSSEHVLIKYYGKIYKDIETHYNIIENNAKLIYDESNKLINIYLTGSLKNTAIKLFEHYNKNIKIDDVDNIEFNWLNKATVGPMIYCNKGYNGPAAEYDINSFYPSILRSNNFYIPLSKPKYDIISEIPEKLKYCIIRCKIDIIDYRIMKTNKYNYYTHHDIKHAKLQNYKIQLIQDDKPNIMYYENIINGNKIFKEYVDLLYDLKTVNTFNMFTDDTRKYIKQMMSMLWGALVQENTIYIFEDNIHDNMELIKIVPITDEKFKFKIRNKDKPVKYGWYRMKPFLLSLARVILCRKYINYLDNVVRIHTDSMWLKDDTIKVANVGKSIGQLKCKKYKNIQIINNNEIIKSI